ncbi:MAG: hypothetical protein HKN26_05200 [Acidimicrobiales bacterium]|nr:hypothetical protein [Acidimicrobiales bacterium]
MRFLPVLTPRARVLRGLTVLWFVALLAVPGVLSLVRDAPESVEQRLARPFPEIDVGGIWNGEVFSEVDGHLQDRLAIRDRAIDWHAWFSYELLRDSTNSDVLVGEGEWLYYGPVFSRPCDDAAAGAWPEPGALMAELEMANRRLAAAGIDFFVTRVVEKGFIETDYLPGAIPGRECTAALQADMRNAFAPSEFTIDLWGLFEDAASPERPLYWARDTHWNDRGRVLAVEALVESMAPGVWDIEPVEGPDREIVGEPARLIGIDGLHRGPRIRLPRPEITTTETRREQWIHCFMSEGAGALVPGRTVVLTDSHLWRSEALLAPWFEELCLLNWRGEDNPAAAATAAEADRILLSLSARETASLARWADRLADWAE